MGQCSPSTLTIFVTHLIFVENKSFFYVFSYVRPRLEPITIPKSSGVYTLHEKAHIHNSPQASQSNRHTSQRLYEKSFKLCQNTDKLQSLEATLLNLWLDQLFQIKIFIKNTCVAIDIIYVAFKQNNHSKFLAFIRVVSHLY